MSVLEPWLTSGSVVVLAEKDPSLRELAVRTLLPSRQYFWLEDDTEAAVQDLLSRLNLDRLRRCVWFPITGGWLLHAARYREVLGRLEAGLAMHWANRMTSLHLGPLWIRNLFDNLASPAFASLPWPHWGEDPVVVCGAGTSLEAWLPALKQKPNVRVLAADTALPTLLAAGVRPDGVVCVEAQQANLRDFLPGAGSGIALFADVTSHPTSRRALGGPVWWFNSRFAPLALWSRWPLESVVPCLDPLGSVGVTAVALAHRLTSGSVTLAGLDFSWPEGKTHAKGAPALTALLQQTTRLRGTEQPGTWSATTNSTAPGGFRTTSVLKGYAASLAQIARPQTHRTSVLGAQGLELGLSRLDQLPAHTSPKSGFTPRVSGTNEKPTQGPVLAQSLVKQELTRLELLLGSFEAVNRGAPGDELLRQLAELDYLYFHFPDPEVRLESSFLSRALLSARWLHGRLSRRHPT